MSEREPKLPLFPDADETVQAIHQGDVDAVVVMRALDGPQVILLLGTERPGRGKSRAFTDRGHRSKR